ncbi:hypothetical protein EV128_10541 [Rhizobium azibense]|nr:hypothetical protein EV128_10541 [Rhizobium azibense]
MQVIVIDSDLEQAIRAVKKKIQFLEMKPLGASGS